MRFVCICTSYVKVLTLTLAGEESKKLIFNTNLGTLEGRKESMGGVLKDLTSWMCAGVMGSEEEEEEEEETGRERFIAARGKL